MSRLERSTSRPRRRWDASSCASGKPSGAVSCSSPTTLKRRSRWQIVSWCFRHALPASSPNIGSICPGRETCALCAQARISRPTPARYGKLSATEIRVRSETRTWITSPSPRVRGEVTRTTALPIAAKLEQRVEGRHQQSKRMLAHSRTQLGNRRGEIADATDIGGLEHDRAKETVATIGLDATLTVAFTVARGRHQ